MKYLARNNYILPLALLLSLIGMSNPRASANPSATNNSSTNNKPGAIAVAPLVVQLKLPAGGIQPRAAVDQASRKLHVIYFVGDPAHGDLYYISSSLSSPDKFTAPVKVNHIDGSACALGSIRGAQMAVGKGGQVYVVWNGSDRSTKASSSPFLFTRLAADRKGFEPERTLLGAGQMIDGGGAVAADDAGNVYALWHAFGADRNEQTGHVYLSMSKDDGQHFAPAKIIDSGKGTCACCGMDAAATNKKLYVLYRSAKDGTARDANLLISDDKFRAFREVSLNHWQANGCPMTLFGFAHDGPEFIAAWEKSDGFSLGKIANSSCIELPPPSGLKPKRTGATGSMGAGPSQKFPAIAVDNNGTMLVACVVGSSWGKGGTLKWSVANADAKDGNSAGDAASATGRAPLLPWSFGAAVTLSPNRFAVIY